MKLRQVLFLDTINFIYLFNSEVDNPQLGLDPLDPNDAFIPLPLSGLVGKVALVLGLATAGVYALRRRKFVA